MVEVQRKTRTIKSMASVFVGVILLIVLIMLLGTPIIQNKVDFANSEARSLFCTFSRVDSFKIDDVMSNATGEILTRINIHITIR